MAKKDNFWEAQPRRGRKRLYETPEDLLADCMEYFEYVTNNPLIEIDFRGKDAKRVRVPKMNAMSWAGLHVFLGVRDLEAYKERPEFSDVIAQVNQIMYTQKFAGAAAGFLNPNIIARDLGLADKKEIKAEGMDQGGITVNIVKGDED